MRGEARSWRRGGGQGDLRVGEVVLGGQGGWSWKVVVEGAHLGMVVEVAHLGWSWWVVEKERCCVMTIATGNTDVVPREREIHKETYNSLRAAN